MVTLKNSRSLRIITFFPFIAVLLSTLMVCHNLYNGIVIGKLRFLFFILPFIQITSIMQLWNSRLEIKLSIGDIILILLFMYVIINTILIPGNDNRIHLVIILLTSTYIYFRILFIQNINYGIIISYSFVVIGTILSIWGALQLYDIIPSNHSLFKLTGPFNNPGPYAGFICSTLPFSVNILIEQTPAINQNRISKWLRRLSVFHILLVASILPATMSRSAWIATIISLSYLIFTKFKILTLYRERLLKRKFIIFIIPLLAVCIGIFFYYIFNLKKDSANGRLLIWRISLEQIIQEPVLGRGINSFPAQYGYQQKEYLLEKGTIYEKKIADFPQFVYNEYIQVMYELGIIGLALLIILLLSSILKSKTDYPFLPAYRTSLLLILLFANTSYPFRVIPFLLMTIILLAYLNSAKSRIPFSGQTISIIVLSMLTVYGINFRDIYNYFQAHKSWKEAKEYYDLELFSDVVSDYEKLFPYLKRQTHYLFEYGRCLYENEEYERSILILQKGIELSCDPMFFVMTGKNFRELGDIEASHSSFIMAKQIIPNRIYPIYLLAKLHYDSGDNCKAKFYAYEALNKSVKVESQITLDIKDEMKMLLFSLNQKNYSDTTSE